MSAVLDTPNPNDSKEINTVTTLTTATEERPHHTVNLTAEQFSDWIDALRNGEYMQTDEQLRKPLDTTDEGCGYGFCCLGVLSDRLGVDLDARPEYLLQEYLHFPEDEEDYEDDGKPAKREVRREPWLNRGGDVGMASGTETGPAELLDAIPLDLRERLASMNDSGRSFVVIADVLERDLAAGVIDLAGVPA